MPPTWSTSGIEKQQDIREGVKALQARLKEFLPYLQDLAAKGPERETYKDNLDDAIEATQDAAKECGKSREGNGAAAGAAQTVVRAFLKIHRGTPPRPSALPGGDRIFQRIFTRLGCQGRPPQFHVELYPTPISRTRCACGTTWPACGFPIFCATRLCR